MAWEQGCSCEKDQPSSKAQSSPWWKGYLQPGALSAVLKTRVTLACWAVACCSASPLLFLKHESGIMPILSRGLHMPRALQNPHALEM